MHAALLLSTLRGMESLGRAGMSLDELRAIGAAALAALPVAAERDVRGDRDPAATAAAGRGL
ncbi:MAG: hypothetical protein PGN13_10610 [Patulibacter minatonensis]